MFDKKNIAKILEEDLKDAQLSCMDFKDDAVKKRAFIDVLGARLAMKILFSKKIEANNLYSLYTIQSVLEDLDVADIYFEGIKIDVRLVFNKEEIFIPKSHSKLGLEPDVYAVLLLKDDMSSVEFLGYFEPKEINKENQNKEFYFFDAESLKNPDEFKKFLEDFSPESNLEITEESSETTEGLFLSLVDKEITTTEKEFLFKKLSASIDLREKLVEFENFEIISKELAKDEDLFQDNVLDIVGAQKLFNEDEDNELAALAEEHLEEDKVGEIDLDDGFEIIENPDDEDENTDEKDEKNKKDSNNGLGFGAVLAAGAVAGAAAAAGLTAAGAAAEAAASTAGAQEALIKGSADVLSNGLDLGKEAIKGGFETADDDLDFQINEDEDGQIEYEIPSDEEPEIENLPDEELPELNTSQAEENSQEFDDLEEFAQKEQDDLTQETELSGETQDLAKSDKDDSSEEILEAPVLDELPELDDLEESGEFAPLEDLEDTADVTQDDEQNSKEEVYDGDSFDFDSLQEQKENSEDGDDSEELMSFESIGEGAHLAKRKDEEELAAKIREIEEQEEAATTDNPDEFIAQVDDFLKDVEFTDEQKNLIETTLGDDTVDEASQPEIPTEKTEVPEVQFANPDGVQDEANDLSAPVFDESLLEDKPEGDKADKDLLNVLFEDDKNEVMPDMDMDFEPKKTPAQQNKNKKMIIAASIASVVLVSAVIGSGIMHNKPANPESPNNLASAPISTETQAPVQTSDSMSMDDMQQNTAQTSVQDIPGENQSAEPADMSKSVSNAFSSEPTSANISKVAWEVPEDLAYNDNFRKYLQIAGKNLKLNLQNNLLLATEMAYSNKVVVDLNISDKGDLTTSNIIASSGSKQIDKIVLQSVKETMKYLKVPTSELNGQSTVATLIINF